MTIFYVDFQKHSESLVTILQSECETAINWLYNNNMIVNPDKFQVILLDQGRSDNTNIEVAIGNGKIKEHINKICESARNQLNALIRLKPFLGLKEKEVLVNSSIYLNFNHCPVVWMLSQKKSLDKIESLLRKKK